MTRDFFDPTPEEQHVILIDSTTLRKAEQMIASCEHCNPEATMLFDWILHRIGNERAPLSVLLDEGELEPLETDYVMEEPAECPNCKREVLEKTRIEAVWFRDLLKLAGQGDPEAQVNLGRLYDEGLVVRQDRAEAVKWFRKAADQGDSNGQVYLGGSLISGKSNPQDEAEAIELFRKAADHGNVDAMSSLGTLYANGGCVAQDYVRAHMWYNLAASGPSSLFDMDKKELAERRDELAAKMTPQQVAEAQRLAREWKPTKPT